MSKSPKILLCSVFGPYAQDDEYGSRIINPMELYHNQVTRVQGPFSLRMFHRSWGLMMIQVNINAPCLILDFPTLERFVEEIKAHQYGVIGISAIAPNVGKVKKMCELTRQIQPNAVIVVGGHIANMPDLDKQIDADHIVKGEGISWFRNYLGEDANRPFRHPGIVSGLRARNAGINLKDKPGDVAATLIPSVGCPLGCNFCSTSWMFGGKGKCVHFYRTGEELFDVMCQLEEAMKVCSFFIMDENFLLHRQRALRLLELMELHNKSWSLYVFSSANMIRSYTMDQLVRLGISWVWMGLEGKNSQYTKLHGIDTVKLVKELQENGIRVLGSTIIGLAEHTPENIGDAITYAVDHKTDFHQFMLYSAAAGTPLYTDLAGRGLMRRDVDPADCHGQDIFNYKHPNIPPGDETEMLLRAFRRDFEVNGPSAVRIARTTLSGWLRHKNHPDPRVRNRFKWEARSLATQFSALVGATQRYFRSDPAMFVNLFILLDALYKEFGLRSWLSSMIGGWWLHRKIRQEEERLTAGWTYEPPTICERNEAVQDRPEIPLCRFVEPIPFRFIK